jgi:hypothetical protein
VAVPAGCHPGGLEDSAAARDAGQARLLASVLHGLGNVTVTVAATAGPAGWRPGTYRDWSLKDSDRGSDQICLGRVWPGPRAPGR